MKFTLLQYSLVQFPMLCKNIIDNIWYKNKIHIGKICVYLPIFPLFPHCKTWMSHLVSFISSQSFYKLMTQHYTQRYL